MTMNAETTITLAKGAHSNPEEGMCLLEAASFVAGEAFSDTPQCVSPVLGSFGRALNDALPTDKRQELVPLIPRIIGTRGDGKDERRSYLALDWLIRTHLPTFLDLAIPDEATKIRALQPITDLATAEAAGPVVRAAGDAAGAAAWDAAWDAARDAAREFLAPTVEKLQADAIRLLSEQMIDAA
ncbi:hypothetical protein CQ031_01400 [Microbacterium sp. MYb40]|nr:hypothetical protein CQ031_01400 [Microbacterium sp. MYb40]